MAAKTKAKKPKNGAPASTGSEATGRIAGRFAPGTSGNPGGRPMGARQRLSEDFINALSDDFAKHGVAVVQQVREEKPVAYLELVAALMPKNVNVEHSGASAFAALWDAIAEGKAEEISAKLVN